MRSDLGTVTTYWGMSRVRQRHVRHLDEKLVPFKPEGLHPGNLVLLVCFFFFVCSWWV